MIKNDYESIIFELKAKLRDLSNMSYLLFEEIGDNAPTSEFKHDKQATETRTAVWCGRADCVAAYASAINLMISDIENTLDFENE